MQQIINPVNGPIKASITVPGSKTISLRAILLAALAEGVSEISGIYVNSAIRALVNALHQLGIVAQLDEEAKSCIIAGGGGKFPKRQATLWCDHSKAVARFLLTACAATPGVYYLDGPASLRKQSLSQLLHILYRQGMQLIPSDARKLPFTMIGADSLEGGEINLDQAEQHHFISGLILLAPYARSPFTFTMPNLLDQPDINLTCNLLSDFGVMIHRIHQGQFMVPTPQRYQARDYEIEPDLTLAAYYFAAAAITNGEISIKNGKRAQSRQKQAIFLSWLEQMGCHVHETANGITVQGTSELRGIELQLSYFSSTLPALLAIAPFAKSASKITFTCPLKEKETNLLIAIKAELTKLGLHIDLGNNFIEVLPGNMKGCIVSTHHNHRIAMALSMIGLKVPEMIIADDKKITKIYPDFFNILQKLNEKETIPITLQDVK
ncbi:MAG: hypothetical protein A3F14_02770 [Gammaproteobacteria bacterium RIFCSPHIGHO2_12_FULL_43_28]|nr:MAG: hypothetical protein A3F14_02770 [Gammaproteobacteria bacterium RIFCSPHIGHO2_12_FULL_43_28]